LIVSRSRVLVGLPVAEGELHLLVKRPCSLPPSLGKHKLALGVEVVDGLVCVGSWRLLLVLLEALAPADDRVFSV
jgi:hypothetical protein